MQRRDKIVLQKIVEEIDMANKLIDGNSLELFLKNEMMKRAVAMTVINVGELVKTVTEELRIKHKEVPWKAAAGLRDITAHRYQTLRMEDVYFTAVDEFIKIKEQIINILEEESIEE